MTDLNVWFVKDVERLLSGLSAAASRYEDGQYRSAYLDAVDDVGRLFGVDVLHDGTGIVVPARGTPRDAETQK